MIAKSLSSTGFMKTGATTMNDPVVSSGSETASPQVDARQRLWHDLRGRLNCVLGFAELMLDGKVGPLAPQHAEFLGDIHTSARAMLSLIDEAASGEAHAPPPASPPERQAAVAKHGADGIKTVIDAISARVPVARG